MNTTKDTVHFTFYADEATMPGIITRTGESIELPLTSTAVETELNRLPRVYLGIRARHLDIVTVGQDGWPKVMFEDKDLVDLLMVSKVEYESGDAPGDGTVTLMIELGEQDSVTFE